jgi:hypothetical protein
MKNKFNQVQNTNQPSKVFHLSHDRKTLPKLVKLTPKTKNYV